MHRISDIQGMGRRHVHLFHDLGIDYQEQFLKCCRTQGKRRQLSRKTGIESRLILKWASQAELAKIHRLNEECIILLERCGITTLAELAHRRYDNLYHQLKSVNQELPVVDHLPSVSMVKSWIEAARSMPKIIQH